LAISVSVIYPNSEGARFDMDYYVNSHLKMVKDSWYDLGMKSITIHKGISAPKPGTPPPFLVIGIMEFDSIEDFYAAGKSNGKEMAADLANFTNIEPVVQINERAD